MTTLRSLRDVRLADAPEVGGKAASLGDLIATGTRVPDGVVLTAEAAGGSPRGIGASIPGVIERLGPGPFAVRSSGIAEDGADRSFAGMFRTELDVTAGDVRAAVERVAASAAGSLPSAYAAGAPGGLAVIVQEMVTPVTAGVALTADPITGDRETTIVTAVRGSGDQLVSGTAVGEEWAIRDGRASVRRRSDGILDHHAAMAVGAEARRIADARGMPQDVEWAIDRDHTLWILQARPMTALPAAVSWEAPAPGAYSRTLRLGEWIGEPVTTLFESWLLSGLEAKLHARIRAELGQRAPLPHHVIVNGWYFYSIEWISPRNMLRSAPSILAHVLRDPRRAAGVIPLTVRFSYPILEREWRAELQPRYRAAVATAAHRVEEIPIEHLPAFIDGLVDLAGEYLFSVVALAGAAYKAEMNLAGFYRRHLAPVIGGSHLPLLAGLAPIPAPTSSVVLSLDWWFAPLTLDPTSTGPDIRARVIREREDLERAAFDALARSPRRTKAFRDLLYHAQHLAPIREEQVAEWTLPWAVMRRAVVRIGEALAGGGVIGTADDVFFARRREVLDALGGSSARIEIDSRRAAREQQRHLVPPLMVGRMSPMVRRVWDGFPGMLGAVRSERAIVTGSPASAGRVTGSVRIVRGLEDFDALQEGEVLVAPVTAPAWTPLFRRAVAVVTDVGSAAAHASIIAREYGIPAVVGCGDATARLHDGMQVTVDGATGNVEPA